MQCYIKKWLTYIFLGSRGDCWSQSQPHTWKGRYVGRYVIIIISIYWVFKNLITLQNLIKERKTCIWRHKKHKMYFLYKCEHTKQVLTKFRVDGKVNLRLNFKINRICNVDTEWDQKTKDISCITISWKLAWTAFDLLLVTHTNLNSQPAAVSILNGPLKKCRHVAYFHADSFIGTQFEFTVTNGQIANLQTGHSQRMTSLWSTVLWTFITSTFICMHVYSH